MKIISIASRIALVTALIGEAQIAFAQEVAPDAKSAPESEIIVTGTRLTGLTAAESAAPIKLIGSDAITHVGQPNLNQVLTQLVPSFTAESFGGDAANLTLSAALRSYCKANCPAFRKRALCGSLRRHDARFSSTTASR